ncbi:hypothetical protein ANCDUO_00425 [Ancylostoma duodenale]|uniref:Uncharacterized protein n=1 Tax=Ancylostoma duodenale TaxID=51022 RepID=A0A0C2H5V6_9BILA|nr:hypothetical protein ANCDUO_00425 [Ancylostoma duodenale]
MTSKYMKIKLLVWSLTWFDSENHVLPWVTEHYENGHWILQQAVVPAHLAKSTHDWYLANPRDASEWPANLPELNVLDFSIWAMLEQKDCQK